MQKRTVILIVEDDSSIQGALSAWLIEEGYTVLGAANGSEAIPVLERHGPPALILLDLMMPVMNGWEFRRWQQTQPAFASVPVVLLSAAAVIAGSAEWLDVAGCLRKPVDPGVLSRIVARLAGPATPAT